MAEKILENLDGRNVVCLRGELGAGKTTFVSGMGQFLGIKKIVSPTFILIRKHLIKKTTAHLKYKILWHVDLYRLETIKEVLDLGLTDLWQSKTNLVVIEWPEKITHLLPEHRVEVKIKSLSTDTREFEVDYL